MKYCRYFFVLLVVGQFAAAAKPVTWTELSYLQTVKRESKVFRQFRAEYELEESEKGPGGNFHGRDGITVICEGDDIVIVGVCISESSLKLPFGLTKEDDLFSGSRKLGITPTEGQKAKAKGYLEVLIPNCGLVLFFEGGHLTDLWMETAKHQAERTSDKRYFYTVKLIDGQVFLSMNSDPKILKGPFVRKSEGRYECEAARGEGVYHLLRYPERGWYYDWTYVQMSPLPVNGTALEKGGGANQALLPTTTSVTPPAEQEARQP